MKLLINFTFKLRDKLHYVGEKEKEKGGEP